MDRQEYLNQISMKSRPAKNSKSGIFASKFFWVGVIGAAIFILILIIGGILSGARGNNKDRLLALVLHIDNTSEAIGEYQPNVKSSDLRSYSASLNGVLSNTSRELTNYIAEKYNMKPKDANENIAEEETLAKDDLVNELFEAKINGNLDRIYAHKMAYEISLITSREIQLYKSTNNESLKEILDTSYNSLSNLYDKFNDFSETK
ncbi:hypothetical protein IIY68_02055 [Candidatus Saccharibacteria bacterium]|nr:hypothetical protein [Candidatus Saccharibacteria bacterium]